MKRNGIFLAAILLLSINAAGLNFDQYFNSGSLRVDYFHSGNSEKEFISNDAMYHEPFWGGSKINLIDTFNYGHYKYEVYDSLTNSLIYSKGYSTLFGEWRYTDEAKNGWRTFSETVIMPQPKKAVKLVFYTRLKNMEWKVLYTRYIDPSSYMIRKQDKKTQSTQIYKSGPSDKKVDIVLIAEGYTSEQQDKFAADANRFKDYFFSWSPFNKMKDRFNIWVVPVASLEEGTDIPGKNVWRNTAFDSHFYTFGTERYINTVNNKAVRDAASNVPYDQIYILVNTNKYGGAGIFNYYSICTVDNANSEFVFLHEFGHAFAGLADEYYSSDVAVEDFYDLNYEPWEPNITTLANFPSKWKALVDSNTPIPTLAKEDDKDLIGLFEGAGYVEKGVYRPRNECSMKSVRNNDFCPVCERAIIQMIDFIAN